MAITIQGARIESISLSRDGENDEFKVSTAEYSLMSSTGKVLAKQTIGGYGKMTLVPSVDTVSALRKFNECYQRDVQQLLGLDE